MMDDKELARKLLQMVHDCNPPEYQDGDWVFDVTLNANDGWKINLFYDCGELDYIDSFVYPDEKVIDVWEPMTIERFTFEADAGHPFNPLLCWRGCSDTQRLLDLMPV